MAALQVTIDRDLAAIHSLGFGDRSADIDEWERLSESAREKFMSSTFDMLLQSAISGVQSGGSLNPPTANSVISKLRSAGIDVGPLNSALHRLASERGKPAKAKDVSEFLKAIGIAKDNYEIRRSGLNDWPDKLEAFSSVLGWFETDSRFAMLAADLKFTTYAIYDNAASRVSSTQIDKLTALSEKDLRSMRILSAQLMNDVRERNEIKGNLGISCNQSKATSNLPQKSRNRRDALRACTDSMMAAHYACGDYPPLMGPGFDAWNRCMDRANSAYDSCVASLPPN
jgi:hypothetical protein